MAEKLNGLSRELIFHPGETLREVLEDRGMTQKELAVRTGFSAKHISEVLGGLAPISVKFAAALECVFGVEAEFWMNLQTNYDIECLEYNEPETVSSEELNILRELSGITKYLKDSGQIPKGIKKEDCVLWLRRFFAVNKLTTISKLAINGAFRGSTKNQVNVYVLFAWQRLCEIAADKIELESSLDTEKLAAQLPYIKSLMFKDAAIMQKELRRVFAECGIKFCIVQHFTGAPVQGFIEENSNGEIILCMTIRKAFADIFWFTLFHEIAHILHGDIKERFIDFTFTENEEEDLANEFASNQLLNPEKYKAFVRVGDFSIHAIKRLAAKENVPTFIVVGRLQKEERIPYTAFSSEKVRFVWSGKP